MLAVLSVLVSKVFLQQQGYLQLGSTSLAKKGEH